MEFTGLDDTRTWRLTQRWNGKLRRVSTRKATMNDATVSRALGLSLACSFRQVCRGKREPRASQCQLAVWDYELPSGERTWRGSNVEGYGWIRHRVPCTWARDKTSSRLQRWGVVSDVARQAATADIIAAGEVHPVLKPRSCRHSLRLPTKYPYVSSLMKE